MTYTPEIEEVTRYRFLGTAYNTRAEAEIARATDIMSREIGVTPWKAMRLNPRHVIAVLTDYVNELARIKDMDKPPRICAKNFIRPTNADRWPDQAEAMCVITNWLSMCYEVDCLLRNKQKITAIKVVRLCFGDVQPSLLDARNWVEART